MCKEGKTGPPKLKNLKLGTKSVNLWVTICLKVSENGENCASNAPKQNPNGPMRLCLHKGYWCIERAYLGTQLTSFKSLKVFQKSRISNVNMLEVGKLILFTQLSLPYLVPLLRYIMLKLMNLI